MFGDKFKLNAKSLMGVFVEFEESKTAQPQVSQTAGNQPTTVLSTVPLQAQTTVQASPEDIQKFFSMFENLLKTNNLKGPDFIEFEHMVQELEKDGITDDMALKSAFVALKMQGLTKEYLLQSITHYLEVVNKDYNTNTQLLTDKQAELNSNFQLETNNTRLTIEENERKIKELQEANQQLKDSLSFKEQELTTKLAKATNNHNIYTNVYKQVIEHLNSFSARISSKL